MCVKIYNAAVLFVRVVAGVRIGPQQSFLLMHCMATVQSYFCMPLKAGKNGGGTIVLQFTILQACVSYYNVFLFYVYVNNIRSNVSWTLC